jgi:hypothetical protein
VAGCAAFIALLLGATDVSLVIAAALVCGAWVRLVLLGDGERELQAVRANLGAAARAP